MLLGAKIHQLIRSTDAMYKDLFGSTVLQMNSINIGWCNSPAEISQQLFTWQLIVCGFTIHQLNSLNISHLELILRVATIPAEFSRKIPNLKINLLWVYNSIVIKPVKDSISSTEITLHYLTQVSLYRLAKLVNSGGIGFKHYSAECLYSYYLAI